VLNLFFLVLCPKIQDWSIIASWYNPSYGVGYVFVANIMATAIQTLFLLPAIVEGFRRSDVQESKGIGVFSWNLLKQMLKYSLPLLVLGVCGIMNQTLDRILFPFFYTGEDAQTQLGIYGACFKVAMVMMMFTQAFRYAYEPFVFAKHKDRESVAAYADAMKYYIIFSYMILLGMIVYLDMLKFIIAPSYWEGLKIVPIVLWTYIFQGVYFNLSFWYKLTDKTQWGAYFSIIGVVITFALQLIFVPRIGYMASALSSTVCYMVIMLLSYLVGRKHLTIPYDLRKIGLYTAVVLAVLAVYYTMVHFLPINEWIKMGIGTILLIIYCGFFYHLDGKTLLKKG
jgi:O-antigen/teichoic acid export membrane protein